MPYGPLHAQLETGMPPSMSESEKWFSVSSAIRGDDHPGSVIIRNNLPTIRSIHESHPHSKILLIGGKYEDQWHGAVGVFAACNIVTMTFIYVKPDYRREDVFVGLLNAIRTFGQGFYYGFVRIPCPAIPALQSMHDVFSAQHAASSESYTLPDGTVVVSYLLPRLTFESLVP